MSLVTTDWLFENLHNVKIIDSSFKKKIFYLNNFGNHDRDFTYIKDVIEIICRLKFDNKKNYSQQIIKKLAYTGNQILLNNEKEINKYL